MEKENKMDWIGNLLLLVGMCFLSSRKRFGWVLGITGNGFWIAWALPRELWSVIAINLAFTVISFRGLILWGRR